MRRFGMSDRSVMTIVIVGVLIVYAVAAAVFLTTCSQLSFSANSPSLHSESTDNIEYTEPAPVAPPTMTILDSATPAPSAYPQIVVDNDTEGFSHFGFDIISKGGNKEFYGENFRSSKVAAAPGECWARWTPNIPISATYEVFMKWSSDIARPNKAPVTVVYHGGDSAKSISVNQQIRADAWCRLGSFSLRAGTDNYVEITNAEGVNTIADAVKFVKVDQTRPTTYTDDFEDEATGSNPSHWIESNEFDEWEVETGSSSGNVYQHVGVYGKSAYSWLHVFEQDTDMTTAFKIVEHNKTYAFVGLSVRFNSVESQITCGYNPVTGCFEIRERIDEDREWITLASSQPTWLSLGDWHTIRAIASGPKILLFVDGQSSPVLSATNASLLGSGRVALVSEGASAHFDNVSLSLNSNQGRVEDGVLDYTLSGDDDIYREGATVVPLSDGSVAIRQSYLEMDESRRKFLVRDELWKSTNEGQTFEQLDCTWPNNPNLHHSILKLNSGKLLNMIAENEERTEHFDYPVRFRAMTSEDDGASWKSSGLIWDSYREGGIPDKAEVVVVNDKLSQISTGRVFYVIAVRVVDGQSIIGHWMEIYYSDDEGSTWKQSETNSNDFNLLYRTYGEGKVVETANGELRLYVPYSDQPTIRCAVSVDEGVHWSGEQDVPGLMNARSSFGIDVDNTGSHPVYFMVWVFNDINEHTTGVFPRSRLALAASVDGINWYYAMDLDRWVSERDQTNRPIVQFVDPSITVTERYIYVTTGRSESDDEFDVHNDQKLHVYRVDRSKINVYDEWPAEY